MGLPLNLAPTSRSPEFSAQTTLSQLPEGLLTAGRHDLSLTVQTEVSARTDGSGAGGSRAGGRGRGPLPGCLHIPAPSSEESRT